MKKEKNRTERGHTDMRDWGRGRGGGVEREVYKVQFTVFCAVQVS